MLVLTFQTGRDRLALDVRRVREVVPRVPLRPVAGAPAWVAGVFIYRAQVVPVIDLHRLIGAGECPTQLSTRIVLVPYPSDGRERLVGLLASQVSEIREMQPPSQAPTRLSAPDQPDLGPVVADGREIVHVVELDRLLPERYVRQLALVPVESPP
jgi:chemotaxis-related protein WspB